MPRGSKFPTFFDWKDPTTPARQSQSIAGELVALWNALDERAATVVVPSPKSPTSTSLEYQAAFGEHVMVSPSATFLVRLPWTSNQDEGRFVVVSRDRVEHAIIVLAGTQPPGDLVTEQRQTINGVEAYLLPSTLSPVRFRVSERSWRI